MGCNIVSKWQGFINVSELFSYKDSLFILPTTRKEDFRINSTFRFFFFGKLTYVLKEEDTNIIRGIPQIYNDNINIKQQMATG
jgi:hypothetical protein